MNVDTSPSSSTSPAANIPSHKCSKCEETFTTTRKYLRHQVEAHSGIRCKLCNIGFRSQDELKLHSKGSHPTTEEKEDLVTSTVSSEMLPSRLEYSITCSICEDKKITEKEPQLMLKHFQKAHKNISSSLFKNHCKQSYGSPTTLLESEHKPVLKIEKLSIKPIDLSLSCKFCFKTFQSKHKLSSHERRHTDKKYSCQVCKKKFAFFPDLKRHINSTKHDRTKPKKTNFKCKHNPNGLKTNKSCCKHSSTLDEKDPVKKMPKLACGVCGASYVKATDLAVHMTCHTSTNYLTCEVCDFITPSKSSLNTHYNKSHPNLNQPTESTPMSSVPLLHQTVISHQTIIAEISAQPLQQLPITNETEIIEGIPSFTYHISQGLVECFQEPTTYSASSTHTITTTTTTETPLPQHCVEVLKTDNYQAQYIVHEEWKSIGVRDETLPGIVVPDEFASLDRVREEKQDLCPLDEETWVEGSKSSHEGGEEEGEEEAEEPILHQTSDLMSHEFIDFIKLENEHFLHDNFDRTVMQAEQIHSQCFFTNGEEFYQSIQTQLI